MKIGMFTDAYYPIISGVSISVDTLSRELTRLGHEVFVLTNEHDDATIQEHVVRFTGKRLPMKGMKEYRIGKVTNAKINEVGTLDLDIVHCHTEFSMGRLGRKAAKRFNISVVHTYHTMYEDYIHYITKMFAMPLKFLSKKYSKSFANSADAVIFPTVKVKRTFDGYGYDKPSSIIPTGIYLEKFRKISFNTDDVKSLKSSLGMSDNDFVMMFLGRMSREKGIESLLKNCIKIFETNNDVKLLLVGGGPDQGYFEEMISDLNIVEKVIFTGMVPPSDVGLYYQLADLFVNFSVTETQGLTYIEALASGVPLLVKYDDNLEGVIVNGVNGFSFTDDLDFVPLFNRIKNDKILLDKITGNSSRNIYKLSAENYAKNILEVYKKLLNN